MNIENATYKIAIVKDETFTLDSVDNKPYDYIFNPVGFRRSDFYMAYSINIDDGIGKKRIALIGSAYGRVDNSAVMEDDTLIVLANTILVSIDCRTISMKSHEIKSDTIPFFKVLLGIYRFDNAYIVHGEIDILKLSPAFEIEWSYSGGDIFITQDGSCPFRIENDIIHLTDWNGRKYAVNKFGKDMAGKTV